MAPSLTDRLDHILNAIQSIEGIIAKHSRTDIANDMILRMAFERLFEIVCEATRHIPAEIRQREPEIDWRGIIDLGNVLRHAYDGIDTTRLLKDAREDLPPLKAFVERILAEESKP